MAYCSSSNSGRWSCSILAMVISTVNAININDNGPIEYCNTNPLQWNFEPLSEHDKERIKTLEQVHILARHGTRIIPTSIHDIFPNSTEKFECEWNGMSTRYFKNSKDWMSLQLHFVNNENIVEGNCAVSQSLSDVIPQHRTNAQMARDFFIGEAPYQLMTQSHLNDIAGQLVYYNELKHSPSIPELKIIAANYERTITSATVFMSEFLDINTPDVAMELFTHDFQSDPYAANKDLNCPMIKEYIKEMGKDSKQHHAVKHSDLYRRVDSVWKNVTGMDYSYDKGEGAVLMYCGGLEVPLSWNQFLDTLNVSYQLREAILSNNETSSTSCSLAASPIAWLFYTLVDNHVRYRTQENTLDAEGEDSVEVQQDIDGLQSVEPKEFYLGAEKAKLVYHSVHDTSILYLLEAMGISNGREPMFAEMLTLEIYSRARGDPYYMKNVQDITNELYENYLFRWTRKGKALAPFPGCEDEMEYTNSSLCRLSILMQALEYGENIKPWEKECRRVTTQYFESKQQDDTAIVPEVATADDLHHELCASTSGIMPFVWTFVFGVVMGASIMVFVQRYNKWFNERWKYESIV